MKVILFLLWCGCAIAQIPSNGYYLLIHKKGKSKGETLGAGVPIKIAIRDSTNKAVWLWSEIESVGRDNLKISSFSKPVAFQNIAFITSKAHFQTRKLKYASAVPGGLLITASGLTMGLVVAAFQGEDHLPWPTCCAFGVVSLTAGGIVIYNGISLMTRKGQIRRFKRHYLITAFELTSNPEAGENPARFYRRYHRNKLRITPPSSQTERF